MCALDYLASAVFLLKEDKWDISTLSDILNKFLFFVPESDTTSPIATTHEPDIFSTEIKSDYHLKVAPLLNQTHVVR